MEHVDYEKDLSIDENALDVEWLEQPSLMLRYTRYQADAKRELAKRKEELNVVRAELDYDIRKNPNHYGLKDVKITNDVVQATILTEKEYKEKLNEYLEAEYEVNMLQGALQAVQQRKDALENMVRLLGLQYFAGPRAPRDISYHAEERRKQEVSNSAIKIVRKRK